MTRSMGTLPRQQWASNDYDVRSFDAVIASDESPCVRCEEGCFPETRAGHCSAAAARADEVDQLTLRILPTPFCGEIVCAFHVARADLDPQDLVLMSVYGTRTALQTWTLTARMVTWLVQMQAVN